MPGATLVNSQCVASPSADPTPGLGAGALCEPTTMPCTDSTFSSCQLARNGEQYCTSTGCTSSAQCPGGYQCNTSTTPSHCRRPYKGQGVACTDNAQCSGFDAVGCATLLGTCAVIGCDASTCDPGYTCFDASSLLPGAPKLCVPSSVIPK